MTNKDFIKHLCNLAAEFYQSMKDAERKGNKDSYTYYKVNWENLKQEIKNLEKVSA